jgi:hypothetical protein
VRIHQIVVSVIEKKYLFLVAQDLLSINNLSGCKIDIKEAKAKM